MTRDGWLLPLPTWKALYDRAEAALTPPLQVLLGTESVNRLFALGREQMMSQQRLMRSHLEQSWDLLRLPTKADLARVAGQVIQLESTLETIDTQLGTLDSRLDGMASPDVQAMKAQLDAMTVQLDSLCTAMATLNAPTQGNA